jgi:DNA-binding transcriptional LysR family regulator
MGILWLPDYMSRPFVAASQLVPVFEDWHIEPMPIHAAFPPNRHVSKKLRVFIDWAAELMAQHASSK